MTRCSTETSGVTGLMVAEEHRFRLRHARSVCSTIAVQKIEAKFDFTMEDFAEAQKANLAEAGTQRGRWVALYALAALVFGVGVYAYVESGRLVIAFGFWLLAVILLMLRRFKLAGATANFRKQAEEFQNMLLVVDDEAVRFRAKGKNLAVPWGELKRFRETDTVFVLYPGGGFLAIPKRALTSKQIEELHSALAEKVAH